VRQLHLNPPTLLPFNVSEIKHNTHSFDWFITKLAQQQEPQTPMTPSLMMTINNGTLTQNDEHSPNRDRPPTPQQQ